MPAPTLFLPTEQACEDYKLRRFHKDYDSLTSSESNSGVFSDALDRLATLTVNAVGVDIPGFGSIGIENQKTFLAGPQFKNKPGNILQDSVAQFSLGLYNGPQSSWWTAKRTQNQPDGGKDELTNARSTNSIWVTAKENIPYKIKTSAKKVNGKPINISTYDYGETGPKVLWKMNILPNWNHENGLEFDHNHEWGSPTDVFTQLLSSVGGTIAAASRMAARVKDAAQGKPAALSLLKTDIVATYQGTEKLKITVPFTLFTKNNFYRDIFYPIMALNSLTHPRRSTIDKATTELKKLAAKTINGASKASNFISGGFINLNDDITAENIDSQVSLEFLNNLMPGMRIFASEPPSYFSIEHSAGIFKFDNCAVTNFSYNYKGPWVTTTNAPQEQADPSKTSEIGIGDAVRFPRNKFWEFWKTEKDVLDLTWQKSKMTYPVMAECSITFQLLDPIFGDDWINQLGTYQKMWGEDVKSSSESPIPPLDPLNI